MIVRCALVVLGVLAFEASGACPSAKEIAQLLEADLRTVTRENRDLKALLESQNPDSDANLESLLGVDPKDPDALTHLRSAAKTQKDIPTVEERFPECRPIPASIQKLATQVSEAHKAAQQFRTQVVELEPDQLAVLIETFKTGQEQSKSSEQLSQAKDRATESLKEAIKDQEQAEKSAALEKDEDAKKLAEARSQLEDRKIKLSEQHLQLTSRLQEENTTFLSAMAQLQRLSVRAETEDIDVLQKNTETINTLWRQYVDNSLTLGEQTPVPELAPLNEGMIKAVGGPQAAAYRESYNQARTYREEILALRKKARANRTISQYKLVVQAGRVRSQYLQALREKGVSAGDPLSSTVLPDYLRELQIVPFRFISLIQAKTADIRSTMGQGLGGVIGMVKDLIVFLVFLLMPFALFWLLSRLSDTIEQFRSYLVRPPFHRNRFRLKTALFLQRLSPYIPWILGYLTIWLGEDLLQGTIWEELSFALPYLRYYVLYRIFLIALQSALSKLGKFSNLGNTRALRYKANKTGRIIGLFFLTLFSVLHATETTVGRALVFHLVEQWMYFLGGLFLILSPLAWREEIRGAADHLGHPALEKAVNRLCTGVLSLVGAAISLGIVASVLSYRMVLSELSELETFKRLSAKLLRRRLEGTGVHGDQQNIENLPDDYTQWFGFGVPNDSSIWVDPPNHIFEKIRNEISDWIKDKAEENTLAVFGEKGAGKSSLFELLNRDFKETVDVRTVTVPPKLWSTEKSQEFFEKLLDTDLSGGYSALMEKDQSMKKTVFLLDDAHNFFVADFGGFDGFRKFLELTNVRLENCYFAASFNIHSWNYLDSVFGRNRFFRTLYSLNTWEEDDIRKLVLSRHKKSGFKLAYDPVVFASQGPNNDGEDHSEVRYFRLLWEQAYGNPRSALYLWLSSLKKRGSTLKVSLPEDTDSDALMDLQQDALFVYSSIVRHENLSSDEAIRTTDLPEGVVRHALKVGMERKFLFRAEDSRYRVSAGWHNTVVNFLTKRNYIHGN